MSLFMKNTKLALIAAGLSAGLCGCMSSEKAEKIANEADAKAIKACEDVKQVQKDLETLRHELAKLKTTVNEISQDRVKVPTGSAKFKWHTIYADAVKEAKEKNLPILIDFTGSDWCGWCIKLDKEVFEKPEWKAWAPKNLVLFKADFPRKKKLPEAEAKVNSGLQKKYGVRGFPTLILVDADGKKLGQLSYQKGGPVKYIETVKATLNPVPIPKAANAAGWYINLEEAKRLAASQKKEILMTMTGKGFGAAEEEKFGTDLMADGDFMNMIKGKYILLHAELVRDGKQSLTLTNQNFGLARKLKLDKLPAVFVLNAKGEKVKEIKSFSADVPGFLKDMKSILSGGSALKPVLKSTGVKAGKDAHGWYVNYEEALKVAKEKNIPLLVDFSGSDWCGWCIKLDKEVFNTPVFKKYSEDGNIVMLMVDSPRKTKLAAPLKKQNDLLKNVFEVKGFPTVLLLDGDGKVKAKAGYQKGGPEKYIEMIKEKLKK